MSNNSSIDASLYLFLKTLYDFTPYLRNPDEQEKLIDMPDSVKKVLREIVDSKIFYELLMDNEYKKAEQKRIEKQRRKEERERQLIEGIKTVSIEDENYENNLKLLKNKRSINTSCFNQRNISTLNQYYNSVNEMMCIKDSVINKIKKIEHDSVISCFEIENKNKIIHDKFIFMNPKKKNRLIYAYNSVNKTTKKSSNTKSLSNKVYIDNNNNFNLLSRGFMSLENYYKFIKENLTKLNNNCNSGSKGEKNKKKLPLKISDNNKNDNKIRIRQNNRFRVYTTGSKNNNNILPSLKAEYKTGINFVSLNKDINYQMKKYKDKTKTSSKEKQFLFYSDYDYKNILSLFK